MENYRGKNVLIFGLGRYKEGSGVSAARFFVRHGARVTVTDLKSAHELKETVALLKVPVTSYQLPVTFHLGGHRMEDIRAADLVIRNPGVPNDSPYLKVARRLNIPVMTDVSVFMELAPCPILGVTGTRGKSTTTALVGEMVRRINKKTFVGGNIQRSPLTFLDKLDGGSLVVLELSSWMLESLADIQQSPWGAIITNIYPDHLNMHRSMGQYVAAKANIIRFQKPRDIAVLNYDDATTRRLARGADGTVQWFSLKTLPRGKQGACLKNGWIFVDEKKVLPVTKLALAGDHNVTNALAATALAHAAGVPIQNITAALKIFRGLPNRQEIVRVDRGITWVNDTTATSPEAVVAALKRFGTNKKVVLITGGVDKSFLSTQFAFLARAIRKHCKVVILLPGTATDKLKNKLGPKRLSPNPVRSMREAVRAAQNLAARNDTVLLSPGAASFGLFKNEFDRGEQFVKFVRAL